MLARNELILALAFPDLFHSVLFCFCGVCLSADWTGAPPSSPPLPLVCFHLCHTKVLIRSALTRFIVCLPAGKQAHYSFARTFTTLASSLSFECGCVCPQTGQVCSYSLILLCMVLCGVFGSVPLGRASLACLGCPCFGWPLPVRVSCGFLPWCCGAPLFRCCCSVVLVWLSSPFLSALVAWVLAVWPALSWFPPFPPPLVVFWCFLVQSVLLVPPSGYLVVFATVRLSYLWHGVSWLIGSCLPSASWQQRLRPCVGLCPLHHVVGVVHVPLAAALRYSPSGDPESP